MSQVAAMLRHVSDVRQRLRNPSNAVIDTPINLKRREVVPVCDADVTQAVPVNSWDVFGPKLATLDDMAFGPVVHPIAPVHTRVTIQEIQRAVADYYSMPRSEMLSARRTWNIVRPRQIAMYLAKRLTLRSLPEIGRRFGGRDHTTVLHAIRKIERLRLADASLDAELAELEEQFVASPSQTEDAPCSLQPKPISTAR